MEKNTESASPPLGNGLKTLYRMQDTSRHALGNHRIGVCHRVPLASTDRVPIYRHNKTKKARYGGLATCGLAWLCPVCATRLARRRRLLLQYIVGKMAGLGYKHSMVTYTLRHGVDDYLPTVLGSLLEAYRQTKEGAPYVRFKKKFGVIGGIKSVEINYGDNGWHPHIHELLFHKVDASPEDLDDAIRPRWEAALKRQGRDANEHGIDVQQSHEHTYEYISKYGHMPMEEWGIAHEMTQQAKKKAKMNSRSSMQILYDLSKRYRYKDVKLWRELAVATYKRAIMFIPHNICELVNVPMLKDDIEAFDAAQEPDETMFADLHLELWYVIRDKYKRSIILTMANESETFEQFKSKVESDIAVSIMRLDNSSLTVLNLGGGVGRGVG